MENLRRSYFAMVPISTCREIFREIIKHTFQSSTNGACDETMKTEDQSQLFQDQLITCTVLEDSAQPPASYRYKFLKMLLDEVTSSSLEPSENLWLETSCACRENKPSEQEEGWRTFILNNDRRVKISHQPFLISSGTTGLSTWDAAFFMVDYMKDSSDILRGKRILELGSGSGLMGMCLLSLLEPTKYLFTDCHPEVLANLKRNLAANSFSEDVRVKVDELNWESFDACGQLSFVPDVVLASDVCFAEEGIRAVCKVLESLKALQVFPQIYIAQKRRNRDTIDLFRRELGEAGLSAIEYETRCWNTSCFARGAYDPKDCTIFHVRIST